MVFGNKSIKMVHKKARFKLDIFNENDSKINNKG